MIPRDTNRADAPGASCLGLVSECIESRRDTGRSAGSNPSQAVVFPRIPPGGDPTLHPSGVGNWVVPFPTESRAVKAIEVSIVGPAVSMTGRSFQPGYLNSGGDFLCLFEEYRANLQRSSKRIPRILVKYNSVIS